MQDRRATTGAPRVAAAAAIAVPAATRGRGVGARTIAGHFAVLFMTMFVTLCTLVTVLPRVAGWSAIAVVSGSMSPVVERGDAVLVVPATPDEVAVGDVILFEDPAAPGRTLHRVVAIDPDGAFVTRGDANARVDSSHVPPDHLLGRGHLLVPFIALPAVWAWEGDWLRIALGFAGIVGLAGVMRWAGADRRSPASDRRPRAPAR